MARQNTVFLALIIFLTGQLVRAQEAAIKLGNPAPEISLPTPKGETKKLSSLRGKLVLVDFWASWCAPCIQEQPELKKLQSKYSQTDKKLEIFGVSLDSKKENWLKAIHRNNISWTQVSDLKFWTSPVARTYEIDALPFNVLVDPKGTIVAINLHGDELDKFIENHLSQ